MVMKNIRKLSKIVLITLARLFVALGGFIVYWDTTSPQTTCASCHEIESSASLWAESGHRSMHCKECHQTAFSNGLHSLVEKGMMVVYHFTGNGERTIRLNEIQLTSLLDNCKRCHGMEYAKWVLGGHSASYSAIFLNGKHNIAVQLNSDCLRCHGMFFEGSIENLVSPVSIKGPWQLMNPEQPTMPVIPCFACHEIHRKGSVATNADYSDPKNIFYSRMAQSSTALFYNRYEKKHIEAENLPVLKLWEGDRQVKVSDDPRQRLCIQCHAPNAFHQAGTSDDRTPRGIHEELSCLACHDNHTNDSRQSCVNCHPAISNCGLDVMKMNTTFVDKNSSHNIHFVRCIDCHAKGIPKKHM
jgi:Cytochrome c3/Cytochrome c554 and c-prime